MLTLFLRPTVYGFALMLAAILAGIAIGSYIVTPFLDRRRKWIAILAGLELAIGIAAVLSFGPLAQMGPLAASLTPALSHLMAEWLVYPTVGSLLAIFPTALLMGLAFPIGLRLWTAGGAAGTRTLASAPRHVLFTERGRRDSRRGRRRILPAAVAREPIVAHRARSDQFRRRAAAAGRLRVATADAGGGRLARVA